MNDIQHFWSHGSPAYYLILRNFRWARDGHIEEALRTWTAILQTYMAPPAAFAIDEQWSVDTDLHPRRIHVGVASFVKRHQEVGQPPDIRSEPRLWFVCKGTDGTKKPRCRS